MHRRGLIFRLATLCVFPLLSAGAGEPRSQFWIIRATNQTADPLVEAVGERKLPPDELASRITAQIQERKIEQLARFDQTLGAERILRKNVTGEMRDPSGGDKIDMGVTVEADVSLARDSQKADMRWVTDVCGVKTEGEYYQKTINASHAIRGEHWDLTGLWKDGRYSTLALVRIIDYPAAAEAVLESPETVLHVDLLEVRPEDLAQFRKSTPGTRQKAMDWLRGRSKALASTIARLKPGQQASHDDQVARLTGERGGFTLTAEQTTSGDGKKVDLSLSAGWQDPEKPATKQDYQFTVGETLDAGQIVLFEPSIGRQPEGALPVLVVVPQVRLPKNPPIAAVPKDPSTVTDKISTQTYPVAAKFMRVVQETQDPNKRVPLDKALARQGLEFPPRTTSSFDSEKCVVVLTQTRQGHLNFMIMLKSLGLQP